MPDIPVQSGQGPNRPKSGKSAVKEKRPSLIDRFSPGGRYEPPATPAPTGETVSTSPQMTGVAPQKNNEVKPAAKTVAAKKPVVKDDEFTAQKKKVEQEKIESDIKAYAREKARRDAIKKLKNK